MIYRLHFRSCNWFTQYFQYCAMCGGSDYTYVYVQSRTIWQLTLQIKLNLKNGNISNKLYWI